jgi:asparagine synthase (glutamine-hydrolysing)
VCGITGAASLSGPVAVDRNTLKKMCNSLVHRGPDDEGLYLDNRVAMGMRRLAIIDVANGQQPMISADGNVVMTFNGEIYNFRELRQQLVLRGHRFRTDSDAEVIVEAYRAWDRDFIKHLDGMFAIAMYDARQGKLLLARDALGIKPLYYTQTENQLIWGSEIKALLASNTVHRRLNVPAVAEFMQWEYVPTPHTLFEGIFKLEPGSLLEVDWRATPAAIKRSQFWSFPTTATIAPRDDWSELVLQQIERATRAQLVSDVPLGAFLSGGVDSSIVAANMGAAQAFSIGFADPTYNELDYARATADHLGINLTTEIVSPQVVDHFDTLVNHLDDPIADFSIFPTYLLSQLASKHVKVALSGDGGDELFGGYDTHRAQVLSQRLGPLGVLLGTAPAQQLLAKLRPAAQKKGLVNKLKRFSEGFAYSNSLGHARWRAFLSPALAETLYTLPALQANTAAAEQHITRLYQESASLDDINRALFVDSRSYLLDNCLVKTDRMSMACSLEVRVPLLDRQLVELAFSIPGPTKMAGNQAKTVLKRAAAQRVPAHCVYRPKEGFSIPMKNWLGGQFRPLLEEASNRAALAELGLFSPEKVDQLKAEHLAGRANHSHILWSIIVLHNWKRRWLDI